MTSPPGEDDLGALNGLHKRLAGGMGPGIGQARPDFATANDTAVWGSEAFTQALRALDPGRNRAAHLARAASDTFTAYLAATPEARRAVAYQPHELLRRLPSALGHTDPMPPLTRWRAMAVVAEALWNCFTAPGISDDERHRLLPVAARVRFLVLSEPFRYRAPHTGAWVPSELDQLVHGYRHHPELDAAFGTASWAELVRRANEARQNWQRHLDTYQSHPLLVHTTAAEFEAEIRALACPDHYRDGPLVLSDTALKDPAHPHTADTAILADAVEHHLLPRFAIASAGAAALHRGLGPWPVVAAAVPLLATAATFGLLAADRYTWTWIPAALAYLAIGAGTLLHGRAWAMPWLLRLPAASAVGLIVLIALHPDWWNNAALTWPVVIVLGGAAYGYLLVKVRNHGIGPGLRPAPGARHPVPYLVAPWRAFTVAAVGVAHAFLVAVIGMTVLAPAFSEKGALLADVWTGDAPGGAPDTVLLLATAWCLAAGVFSQILWDDRPITAPLAHLRWRNER